MADRLPTPRRSSGRNEGQGRPQAARRFHQMWRSPYPPSQPIPVPLASGSSITRLAEESSSGSEGEVIGDIHGIAGARNSSSTRVRMQAAPWDSAYMSGLGSSGGSSASGSEQSRPGNNLAAQALTNGRPSTRNGSTPLLYEFPRMTRVNGYGEGGAGVDVDSDSGSDVGINDRQNGGTYRPPLGYRRPRRNAIMQPVGPLPDLPRQRVNGFVPIVNPGPRNNYRHSDSSDSDESHGRNPRQ